MDGIGIGMLRLYLLLYADDVVVFFQTQEKVCKTVRADFCNKMHYENMPIQMY